MRERLGWIVWIVGGALAAARAAIAGFSLTTVAGVGCFNHVCDSSCVYLDEAGVPEGGPEGCQVVPGPAGDVRMEGSTAVWESSPEDSAWLDFSPMRTLHITYPPGFAAYGDPPECQVAADAGNPQDNAVNCGGNLAQFLKQSATDLTVLNPNCAQGWGLRLVVRGTYAPPDGGASGARGNDGDGGNDGDAAGGQ